MERVASQRHKQIIAAKLADCEQALVEMNIKKRLTSCTAITLFLLIIIVGAAGLIYEFGYRDADMVTETSVSTQELTTTTPAPARKPAKDDKHPEHHNPHSHEHREEPHGHGGHKEDRKGKRRQKTKGYQAAKAFKVIGLVLSQATSVSIWILAKIKSYKCFRLSRLIAVVGLLFAVANFLFTLIVYSEINGEIILVILHIIYIGLLESFTSRKDNQTKLPDSNQSKIEESFV